MRIAIVSDVHGNLTALNAVVDDLERINPDLVLHGGDLIGWPRPDEVVDLIRTLGWPGVVGNADEGIWNLDSAPVSASGKEAMKPQFDATRELLGEDRIRWLQTLPHEWSGHGIGLVHATPGNLWRAVPHDSDAETLMATFGSLGTAIVVYGHIHRPYVRYLPDLIVANAGSVGRPHDGDTRASYLLIEDGTPQIRRVAYDLEAELAVLKASGYFVTEAIIESRRRAIPPE